MYKRGWIAALLFSLAMLNYVDRATLSFAGQEIAKLYSLSPVQVGYLMSSVLWTYTLALIPVGILIDRFGPKKVVGIGVVIWSLATAATGLAGGFMSIISARLVLGLGESTSNPAGGAVIRKWIPIQERGAITAVFNSGSYAGPALCALLAAPIINNFGWRSLFYIPAAFGIGWAILWAIFYHDPERATWLRAEERDKILANRGIKTGDAQNQRKAGLKANLGCGTTLWGIALTQGCNVYAQYLFLTWLPGYLHDMHGLTLSKTGLFSALPYLIAVVLCIVIGKFSDYILRDRVKDGQRRYVIAGTMLLASIVLVTPYITSLPVIAVVLGLSLTGIAATTSLNFSLLNDLLVNPADVGSAMAFTVVGGNVFGLMAPIVTGYIIALTHSYNAAFVVAGVLLLIGAVSALTLTRRPIDPETSAVPASKNAHPGRRDVLHRKPVS